MPLPVLLRRQRVATRCGPLLLLWALAACVSTVTPPADPEDPQAVFVLWDARHRCLALPSEPGDLTVWSYGDWDWYAHNHDAWYDAFATVLWPTQGTLARREVRGTGAAALGRAYPGATVARILVDGQAVRRLRARLVARYLRGGPPHWNPLYATHFVRHGDDYWLPYNCNDAVARWLRFLGCEVSGVPIRLDLTM